MTALSRLQSGYYNSAAVSALNPGGLSGNGHVTNFPALLVDVGDVAAQVANDADDAAAYAQSTAASALTNATSTTNTSVTAAGTTKSITFVETGRVFAKGQTISFAISATPANQMICRIDAVDNTAKTMSLTVLSSSGAGSATAWTIALAAVSGTPTSRQVIGGGLATGGGDFSTDRTITVTASTPAQVAAGTDNATAVTPSSLAQSLEPQTLADGATINWDMSPKLSAKVTIGGNRNLAEPTNPRLGETYVLDIYEDGTGGRTMTFNVCYDFGGITPSMPTAAGARATMTARCLNATPGSIKFDCTFRRAA